MVKRITVKCCEGCPYQVRNYKYKIDLCDVVDRLIVDTKNIPSWCSLEDAE